MQTTANDWKVLKRFLTSKLYCSLDRKIGRPLADQSSVRQFFAVEEIAEDKAEYRYHQEKLSQREA